MLKAIVTLLVSFLTVVLLSLTAQPSTPIGLAAAIAYYKAGSDEFAATTAQLKSAITAIRNKDSLSVANARNALKNCRLSYKKIEFFLEYFFKTTAHVYNGPPKYEVEEPYMEYQTPVGLQVIEGFLFEPDPESRKTALLAQADVMASSAADLNALLYGFTANDKQIMESLRIELIRIYTLGLSGFDAPLLKSGISESFEALTAVEYTLTPYLKKYGQQADSVGYYLRNSLTYLRDHKEFDAFNRLDFYTLYALPLQRTLGKLARETQLDQHTVGGAFNFNAEHLFSRDAINIGAFPSSGLIAAPALISLGKKLFNETALSGNNKISCATCHIPGKHFSDALPKSIAFGGHSHVKRNAASLLYSGFQYEQFWEGRAKSLESQVNEVINSPLEMNGNNKVVITALQNNPEYRQLFMQAFPRTADSIITLNKISASIAAFVRTLNPRNSPFDQYMEGDKTALNDRQKHGFNLFMGKAQCGSCHFAPLFNGLTPPYFDLTELEVLGTPKTDDFTKPEADDDSGRYNVFAIEFYEKAFKTPTVRNVSATAPYMHNGAFKTLENVVEFYNKGGGAGLGLNARYQTLSPLPLHLTPSEIDDIVRFLQSLEDAI